MSIKINNKYGYIEISEDLITSIIGQATMECYGVVGMASKRATDGLWELLKKENLSKGIKINSDDTNLLVEVYIIVEYGTKISVIADNIIDKVKYTIDNLTGLKVSKIAINIQGVRV